MSKNQHGYIPAPDDKRYSKVVLVDNNWDRFPASVNIASEVNSIMRHAMKADDKIKELNDKIALLSRGEGEPLMPLKPYTAVPSVNDSSVVDEAWLEKLKGYRDKNLEVADYNAAIKATNRAHYERIKNIFLGLGFQTTKRVRRIRGTTKDVDQPWYTALNQEFTPYIVEGANRKMVESWWEGVLKAHEAWKVRDAKFKVESQKFEEEAREKAKITLQLIAIAQKYGEELNYMPEPNDVMYILLNQSPLLRLSHHMRTVRNNWDAYAADYVQSALNQFAEWDAKNPGVIYSKAIIEDIAECISHYDGDGRIFRDTQWNYDQLLSLLPVDLVKDYAYVNNLL